MDRHPSLSRKIFVVFNYIFSILVGLMCIAPVLHVFALSLSEKAHIMAGNVSFWPLGITLDNYRYVIKDSQFYTAFGVSVLRVILALGIVMTLTIMAAYPLSMRRSQFPARKVYIWLFVIPMLFSGGLIPTYLQVVNTGVLDTIWALILPVGVPVYNVILLQNFMKALPDSLAEAAYIDGCNRWQTYWKIVFPLLKPTIATVAIIDAMAFWNDYLLPSLVLARKELYTLPIATQAFYGTYSTDLGLVMAALLLAMLPILVLYLFLQRYIVEGVTSGAVKG